MSTTAAPPPGDSSKKLPPPVSLGKPSLRHRLESYYSLVSPPSISDPAKWKSNFESIYEKYGGSVEGETKLAKKLARKYGGRVMLLVAPPHRSERGVGGGGTDTSAGRGERRDESHYELDDARRGSLVLDFASPVFDPVRALTAPEAEVVNANPSSFAFREGAARRLDNIHKFRAALPPCDPLHFTPKSRSSASHSADTTDQPGQHDADAPVPKRTSLFQSLASKYESPRSGPLSLLYSVLSTRSRVRVMVRYVDCVRGVLTGQLVAFDKHLNMILRDADEVYTGRVTRDEGSVEAAGGARGDDGGTVVGPRKAGLEARRRGAGGKGGMRAKQRYFHQMLVRGDNVVMVWRADSERSAAQQPSRDGEGGAGAGTPGSLFYAKERYENPTGGRRRR